MCLFLISVPLTLPLDSVSPASSATTLKTAAVSRLQLRKFLMSAAPSGTGPIENALCALKSGCPDLMASACLFQTTVLLTMSLAPAPPASRGTYLNWEHVSKLLFRNRLMSDVVSGTGTNRSVLSALKNGYSTLRVSVCPFLTNVPLIIALVTALAVTKVTNYKMGVA